MAIPGEQIQDGNTLQLASSKVDLDQPVYYLNRELTWLEFNRRVLANAFDARIPLLERVKFLAIANSNLDEFTQKRLGGLKQQIAAGVKDKSVDGRTPLEQLVACYEVIRQMIDDIERAYGELLVELRGVGIDIKRYADLAAAEKTTVRASFIDNIFPLCTPLAMDPSHPFPFISSLALNVLVSLRFPDEEDLRMARVKVPVGKGVAKRFVQVGEKSTFVLLEDIIINNVDLLFPGMEIVACELFRVTRNAKVAVDDDDADDLLEMIESELRERHFSPIVRLEVQEGMQDTHRGMLAAELGLDEASDVFDFDAMLGMRDLWEIVSLDRPDLHLAPHHAIDSPRLAYGPRNIFHNIREGGPILLQHPYESFSNSVEKFLRSAAIDPKVLAIKMTLYRTSEEGTVIDHLLKAASNGKQVAVLVELKASFDEEANIGWARRLENAGIHVTYGVGGLKTHCKTILVVRKDYNGLRRYAHIGTGNYHSGTARLYSDLGILTCDQDIGQDLTELFNYLTGYSPPPSYRKILAAPYTLKKALLRMIEREADAQTDEFPGLIQFKCNALEDSDIVRALYVASQKGVQVDLIVRDTCRLRPGIAGVSENIRVVSVLGRFLEHTRIFYFRNAGEKEYYIGSADLMRRNLSGRVEVVTPVDDPSLREDLRLMIDIQLGDKRNAWDMQPDGRYVQRMPDDNKEQPRGCQDMLIEMAQTRLSAARKHQQKKVRQKLVNHFRKRLQRNRW